MSNTQNDEFLDVVDLMTSDRHSLSTSSMPMTQNPEASVIVVTEKRRRFIAKEEVELVRMNYSPGNAVAKIIQPSKGSY